MNEVKISVIMPVYRVEDYVGRAIESMQKQTLQEFEFLIVDDGSPTEAEKSVTHMQRKMQGSACFTGRTRGAGGEKRGDGSCERKISVFSGFRRLGGA